MKGYFGLAGLIFAGVIGWQVSLYIDPDVFLVVLGFFFGAVACLPVALLLIAAQRRHEQRGDDGPRRGGYGDYPPMVMLPPQPQQPSYPPAPPQNPWTVTGGGSFSDMPAPVQDGRFSLTGGRK